MDGGIVDGIACVHNTAISVEPDQKWRINQNPNLQGSAIKNVGRVYSGVKLENDCWCVKKDKYRQKESVNRGPLPKLPKYDRNQEYLKFAALKPSGASR